MSIHFQNRLITFFITVEFLNKFRMPSVSHRRFKRHLKGSIWGQDGAISHIDSVLKAGEEMSET